MTAAEKQSYLYKWDRFQKRHERIYTRKFKAALHEQIIQQAYKGYITSVPIYDVLVELYQTVGPLWAHASQVSTKQFQTKARQPMGFLQRIVDLMRQYYETYLLNEAELITTYTREVIQRVLSDAALSGSSINDIVRELERDTELGAMRARRIARTEVVTAANGAAVINAKDTGIAKNKIWLSVHDKRTRHSHVLIDEAVVPMDDAFNVSGTMMAQPGARTQPNGLPVPLDQFINCRCTVAFKVVE
jgi:uncharacterized protein with gpF-like domain